MTVSAQQLNKKILDKTHKKEILINTCTRAGITSFPEFKEMFDPLYASYIPDSTMQNEMKMLLEKTHIKIILGTWCGDSKVYVPQFFKLLDATSYKEKNIEIFAVDGQNKAENGLLDSLNIKICTNFYCL